jgi:hypothetical protein
LGVEKKTKQLSNDEKKELPFEIFVKPIAAINSEDKYF